MTTRTSKLDRPTGVPQLAERSDRLQSSALGPSIPVLLYHSISSSKVRTDDAWAVKESDFRIDMEAVANSGRVALTADQYGRCLSGEDLVPDNAILVTFDDGFADFEDVALPILVDFALPATLFVTSSFVGRAGMLSRRALADVASETSVEIGGHSVTHPHLDVLPTQAAYDEIANCRDILTGLLGTAIYSFAYPHGSHNRRTRQLVRNAGFRTAHAVKNAFSHPADDPLAIARYTVHSRTSRDKLQAVVAGEGAPLARRRERVRTSAYRLVRRWRQSGCTT